MKIRKLISMFWFLEFCLIEFGTNPINIIDISFIFSSFFVIIRLEFDSCLFREHSDRFSIFDFLDFHEEFYGSTAMMTSETVRDIFGWRDNKRWRFLMMKRAIRLIVDACLLHLKISSCEFDNIHPTIYFSSYRHELLIIFLKIQSIIRISLFGQVYKFSMRHTLAAIPSSFSL